MPACEAWKFGGHLACRHASRGIIHSLAIWGPSCMRACEMAPYLQPCNLGAILHAGMRAGVLFTALQFGGHLACRHAKWPLIAIWGPSCMRACEMAPFCNFGAILHAGMRDLEIWESRCNCFVLLIVDSRMPACENLL
jgi:hypothetical protein